MKLENKKKFAAKVLGAGVGRIVFNKSRLEEIKEAMTRQDIRDLFNDGAIALKEAKGRLTIIRRKTRRRAGSIRHKMIDRKRNYIIITRKLRRYLAELLKSEQITKEQYLLLRKEIKASAFKSKAHLKERMRLFKK